MAEPEIPSEQAATPPVLENPPTWRPVPAIRAPQSAWPAAIGAICIVLGGLGTLRGFCGIGGSIVGSFFQRLFVGSMPTGNDEQMAAMRQVTSQYQPYLITSQSVNMIIAIALTVGGIGLVRRRKWSRRVLLHWSWIRMLGVVAVSLVMYSYGQAFMHVMEEAFEGNGAGLPPTFGMMFGAMGAFQVFFALVWGWALPIFMLIWLNRQAIRSEVEQWP